MAVRASDLYFSTVVKLMIDDLRRNRFLVDDILADVVNDPILSTLYGQKEVNKFNLFLDKEIQVNLEYAIDTTKLPAIAIRCGGGTEDTSSTGDPLGDGFREEDVTTASLKGAMIVPRIIIDKCTPILYDSTTGKVTFDSTVDLTPVYPDMVIFDEIAKIAYPILTVIDQSNLFIAIGSKPNMTNCTIRAKSQTAVNIRREFFVSEQVTLICMGVEPVEVIYLYQMMLYLIARNRLNYFETKNFRTTTIQYGPIYKAQDDPNYVFARDINMSGKVEHSYISTTALPIDGNASGIRIASATATPTAILSEVEQQGWKLEQDP